MADYYDYFDSLSDSGRVFDVDLSRLELKPDVLTQGELQGRLNWKSQRTALGDHYHFVPERSRGTSQEDVLCERIVPPNLSTVGQSLRYHDDVDRNPMHPRYLHKWSSFKTQVQQFRGSSKHNLRRHFGNLFVASLEDDMPKRDEFEEQTYIKTMVVQKLARVGLLPDMESRPTHPKHGNMDFHLEDGDRVRVVVETRSTHSLPLPMTAETLIRRFNNGSTSQDLDDETRQAERERDRKHVTYTIGQLLRYMLLNGCRYGILTSGSRTYFVYIADEDRKIAEKVCISDAFFVGENNYLRAWAYIYSLALDNNSAFFPRAVESPDISWASSDGEYHPDDDDDVSTGGDGDKTEQLGVGGGGNLHEHTACESSIPYVSLAEIEFGGVLGYGRNGCVIGAKWEEKDIALKQFDCGREGGLQRFKQEVKAYETLTDVQGLLVPKAFFVSELPGFGIKYLGLQLGRHPSEADLAALGDGAFQMILSYIQSNYGIKHEDSILRNGLVVTDGSGKDRLVVIDWEVYSVGRKKKNQESSHARPPSNLIV